MNKSSWRRNREGDILISLSMFLFGGYALFLRFFSEVPTLSFLFFFQLAGAVGFYVLAKKRGIPKINRSDKLLLIALAIPSILNDLFYFSAFRLTTVANAAIAHQTVSIFLLFLAPIILGERTKRNEWFALVVALLGLVIVYRSGLSIGGMRDIWGITLGLASAVSYGFVIVLYRLTHRRGLSITVVNLWRFTLSTIILLPIMGIFGGFNFSPNDLAPLLGFGFLFAFVAAGIHTYGVSHARSLHASIIGKSEPIIATLYAFLFLAETPTIDVIVGGILIIGSSLWLVLQGEGE